MTTKVTDSVRDTTSLDVSKLSGAVAVAKGGTGLTAVGTSGNVLTSNGSAWASTAPAGGFTLGTPVLSTSGTAIDFTSIPSGTKIIHISYSGVSTNGTSRPIVQIGDAGGIETSGYLGTGWRASPRNYTDGFGLSDDWAGVVIVQGITTLTLLDSSTFTWASTSQLGRTDAHHLLGAGAKSLSAELDRVRITTQGGSDTFDAGKINIQYE